MACNRSVGVAPVTGINPRQQGIARPVHHGQPDGLLVREMTKERTLGYLHMRCNLRSGDVGGIGCSRQCDHRFNGCGPAHIGREFGASHEPSVPLR
jgi:hypothetical protein